MNALNWTVAGLGDRAHRVGYFEMMSNTKLIK